jgi:8-oxo-dGTP diphosphatase
MKHRIRVVGIVRKNDQLLLVKQQNPETGNTYWTLPGGGFEDTDEHIFAGVEREVWEETGVQVKAGRLMMVSEYLNKGSRPMLMLSLFIECHEPIGEPHIGNIKADDYILDSVWLSREEMLKDDTPLADNLSNDSFWQILHTPGDTVLHLGRKVSY